MAGTDTVRGINYQHGQALVRVAEFLRNAEWSSVRVEGLSDAIDLELLDRNSELLAGIQFKTKASGSWGRAAILTAIRKWAARGAEPGASFEFITDGEFGPSVLTLQGELDGTSPLADDIQDLENYRSRIKLIRDATTAQALLAQASDVILSTIPERGTGHELLERARNYALQLFYVISQRSAESDPSLRLITRKQVFEVCGLDPDTTYQGWGPAARTAYLDSFHLDIPDADEFVEVQLVDDSAPPQDPKVPIDDLLSERISIVHGDAGSGKTWIANRLSAIAARTGRVCVPLRAEAYIPGRLAALVAFTLEEAIGSPLPSSVGWEVITDASVSIVIDGASELYRVASDQLAKEVGQLMQGRAANFILVGRSLDQLTHYVPSSRRARTFQTLPWSRVQQRELVAHVLGYPRDDDRVSELLDTLSRNLGSLCSNPFVLRQSTELSVEKRTVVDRSEVYSSVIESRVLKVSTLNVDLVEVALGIVYSALMDRGSRYCDAFEWNHLCELASDEVPQICSQDIEAVALDSGIVRKLGPRARYLPLHDSIADYLAAVSYRKGKSSLPDRFGLWDAGRLSFIAEFGVLRDAHLEPIMRDIPIEAVAISRRDVSGIDPGMPGGAFDAIKQVLPNSQFLGALGWRRGEECWLALTTSEEVGWSDDVPPEAVSILRVLSPLRVVVAAWRQHLRRVLKPARRFTRAWFEDANDAAAAIAEHHCSQLEIATRLIAQELPYVTFGLRPDDLVPSRSVRVEAEKSEMHRVSDFRVHSVDASDFSVSVVPEIPDRAPGAHSMVRSELRYSPESTVYEAVRKAINERTVANWLQ